MKSKLNPFLRTFLFLAVLVLVIVAMAIGLFYYVFSIPEPEGLSLASWPETFTANFESRIRRADGSVAVSEKGLELLEAYGLWIQIIDESGRERFAHDKPPHYPESYAADELIALNASAYAQGSTVFASSFTDSGETFSYLIGFPYAIGKYMLYYNGAHVARLSPVGSVVALAALGAFVLLAIGYGFWLSRQMSAITGGIRNIALRSYQPLDETGTFRDIYAALNLMDAEIRNSDRAKADTDRVRKEWIANITHDLKTPLSPVKGYAELLALGAEADPENVRAYGALILKNVDHAEKLMNDLKLTYQLDSGAIPYEPREVRLTRCVREWVIDIVNDPAFSGREIAFESSAPELIAWLDPNLLRRAIQNIVINALVHNPPDTKVTVSVCAPATITIRDNGVGMSAMELSELFERYYRGSNTRERPEGSGLGLAIARQIVALHGGEIAVQSEPNAGTEFTITLLQKERLEYDP